MRRTLISITAWLAPLAACGGSHHAAQSPDNGDNSSAADTAGDGKTDADKKGAPLGPPGDKDSSGKPSPCAGAEIHDLTAVLAQSACEAKGAKPDVKPRDVSDALEIKVALDARRVAPGGRGSITVTYHNKSSKDLPLYFVVDPEPRFEFEVRTLKGTRVDRPAGPEPALPPEVAKAAAPDKLVALVTIAPQGSATASLPWEAVRHRWVSRDVAKGAAAGHGYPQEPAGPLMRGKYVVRIVTPLVGISEGVDHEMSQPRLNLEVGTP